MINIFKKLFVKKPRIYFIEINDETIDKKLSEILNNIGHKLDTFKQTLSQDTIEGKEEALLDLQKLLLESKQELKSIELDAEKIQKIELENSSFFSIRDGDFLKDKQAQVAKMQDEIQSFLTIVEQRPSKDVLQEEFISQFIQEADDLKKSLEGIIADDSNLKAIYKKLNNL